MIDYRRFVESKLADLERRRAEIEAERERLMTTLSVMDEADSSDHRAVQTGAATPETSAPALIVGLLRSAGRTMTADEIYSHLSQREIARPAMHSALYRLKKRKRAFKSGDAWGLVGRDDDSAQDSVSHESLLANPATH